MTLDYASPGQILSERITLASDVYSLGILLLLIMTGRHPFRGAETKIGGASPGIRHGSVEQHSEDLRRYREDRSVRARRRRTFFYTCGRYLRRHRLAMCMAGAAARIGHLRRRFENQ